jgi:metal-responsive CopG/Arc/MetJ family transcriptional regulator
MKSSVKSKGKIIRRSVAIPSQLLEEVQNVTEPALRTNFNRLVVTALRDYSARKKEEAFEDQMAQMAADPGIRSEMEQISVEFSIAERDGLTHD